MRLGYGYKRKASEFDEWNVDRIWIDHSGTDRSDRTDLLVVGMRPGDTIVLLAPGDLGFGGEIPLLRKEIEARGVKIEVVPQDKRKRLPPGPKSRFQPTPEQLRRLKRYYLDGRYGGRHVYDTGCELAGWKKTPANREKMRQWLFNRFGSRGKQ